MEHKQLAAESQSLALAGSLKHALLGITVVAGFSFAFTTILFFYLTFKLGAWSISYQKKDEAPVLHTNSNNSERTEIYSLGIDGVFGRKASRFQPAIERLPERPPSSLRQGGPNQFFVLVVNLLLADIQQSLAFFLNFMWLKDNSISVGTSTCFAQGFFVSTGDLASSTFSTIIAVHTYMAIVWKKDMSQRTLYTLIGLAWTFVYLMAVLPIAATRNGRAVGGFFVRAGPWCWINEDYEKVRLLTHYLYIFAALFTTSTLYILILFGVQRDARQAASGDTERQTMWSRLQANNSAVFLVYPIIYVTCTLPLASGRLATMAGAHTPLLYLCFAGAMMAANGIFDCLLFSTTRHAILFASKYDLDDKDVGLDTFAFMQTPSDRRFGNLVWIQGGGGQTSTAKVQKRGWWRLSKDTRQAQNSSFRDAMSSQESLRGQAIQMNTVTSVVVESEERKVRGISETELPMTSTTRSMKSIDT